MEQRLFWLFLRSVREARGLSMRAAAKQIGIAQSTLSEIESGRGGVNEDTLIKIAAGYGMTLRELLLEGLAATKGDE